MKRKELKRLSFLLAAVMTVGLMSGCTGSATEPATPTEVAAPAESTPPHEPAAEAAEAEPEAAQDDSVAVGLRDLGGREIIVADWWTDNTAEEQPPANLRDEEFRAYRDGIFTDYNFTLKQQSVSNWDNYLELYTTSVMAGEPTADLYIMSTPWATQLMKQGLLYPVNTVESLDLANPKWNATVTDLFTAADSNVYGITSAQYIEPKVFMYYNKRMFEEAGIDPDEPYDLQASGDWTWDKFIEYCETITRDTDGDGETDVYGFVGFEQEAIDGLIFANDAQYIKRGDDGLFYNAMSEPQFLEAIQFGKSINERGFWAPSPEGANWDWFLTGFHDGYAAMLIHAAYESNAAFADMEDDFGYVFVPKGPQTDDYYTFFEENVYCLPSTVSAEDADEIMFAYNLYTEPLEYDLENPDSWKDDAWGYSRWRDTRTVDDTFAMLYEGRYKPNYKNLVPGIDWGPTFEWNALLGPETANEKVEAAKPVVDAAVAEANK